LTELAAALLESGPEAFDPALRGDLAAAEGDGARLRVVVDQVASMTDVSAVERHRRLVAPA
jgi:dGTPase